MKLIDKKINKENIFIKYFKNKINLLILMFVLSELHKFNNILITCYSI